MRLFARLLIVAAFAWFGYVLYLKGHEMQQTEVTDGSTVALLFAGTVILATIAALILTLSVVPAIAEYFSNVFYTTNQTIEHDAQTDAVAKLAQGDYEGAIALYQKMHEQDPNDTLGLSEIAKICCEKLEDPERAAAVLSEGLERDLPHEQASFLANRLVDVYWNFLHDPLKSREVLIQVVENMPDTRHAINAQHRLREIDSALEAGEV